MLPRGRRLAPARGGAVGRPAGSPGPAASGGVPGSARARAGGPRLLRRRPVRPARGARDRRGLARAPPRLDDVRPCPLTDGGPGSSSACARPSAASCCRRRSGRRSARRRRRPCCSSTDDGGPRTAYVESTQATGPALVPPTGATRPARRRPASASCWTSRWAPAPAASSSGWGRAPRTTPARGCSPRWASARRPPTRAVRPADRRRRCARRRDRRRPRRFGPGPGAVGRASTSWPRATPTCRCSGCTARARRPPRPRRDAGAGPGARAGVRPPRARRGRGPRTRGRPDATCSPAPARSRRPPGSPGTPGAGPAAGWASASRCSARACCPVPPSSRTRSTCPPAWPTSTSSSPARSRLDGRSVHDGVCAVVADRALAAGIPTVVLARSASRLGAASSASAGIAAAYPVDDGVGPPGTALAGGAAARLADRAARCPRAALVAPTTR